MQISVTEAKGKLTDLVRRAEAGDDVVLTRHGHPAVRLVSVNAGVKSGPSEATRDRRRKALDKFMREARPTPGPSAAHSADFLYGDDGLPA